MTDQLQPFESLNVFGAELLPCSNDPVTGFYRDGCCNSREEDLGSHTVCVKITASFLEYSRFKGNDLSTPRPEFGFAGLKEGDSWCLCAARWLEAYEVGMAPKVNLQSTHVKALDVVAIEKLKSHAADLH